MTPLPQLVPCYQQVKFSKREAVHLIVAGRLSRSCNYFYRASEQGKGNRARRRMIERKKMFSSPNKK